MTTRARTAYIVLAVASYCHCPAPRQELFASNKYPRAEMMAAGHWNIYWTFFGHLTQTVDIIVVDTRDGVIQWKNGKPTKENYNG